MRVRVGTAGWSIPRAVATAFPGEGSHLERYARVFACAEINSTFYRSSRPTTYQRWAASVPESFRFAVKVPKAITHEGGLQPLREALRNFLAEIEGGLGARLGPLLFQLPPKREFDAVLARSFLECFRELRPESAAAMEPRHASWFGSEADALLQEFRVARVAADPARVSEAGQVGGWPGLRYHRLHGSPRVYYSGYEEQFLDNLDTTLKLQAETSEVWCVFDNTASGAAPENALRVVEGM